jgi:hypothetical protein
MNLKVYFFNSKKLYLYPIYVIPNKIYKVLWS